MGSLQSLKVLIVGCGLGGLACAIACRRENLEVTMLEKAAELSEIGAGIQLPPNATRIMSQWGLMDKLYEAGMVVKEDNVVYRWEDGRTITVRPGSKFCRAKFGEAHHAMHRADYQRVLANEARRLGTDIRLGCEVVDLQSPDGQKAYVVLQNGEKIYADVIIGADGFRSNVRSFVLGREVEPHGSGELAYRITIPREVLEKDPDPYVRRIVSDQVNALWWGPNTSAVLYGVKGGEMANLVLIVPDDLPPNVAKQPGDLAQMHEIFDGWDPRLRALINTVDSAVKWKIYCLQHLDVWVKGRVALLGDACHASVPHAASGAAMAVEDGAVLGRLLGHFVRQDCSHDQLPHLLQLYQQVRRDRANWACELADNNGKLFTLVEGPAQRERDSLLGAHDWWDEERELPFQFGSFKATYELYAHDAQRSADVAFQSSEFGGK